MIDKLKAAATAASDFLAPKWKAVAGLVIGAVATYVTTHQVDAAAVVGVLAALGVYAVPNKPAAK